MKFQSARCHQLLGVVLGLALVVGWAPCANAQDQANRDLQQLEKALLASKENSTPARQRLALRRVIRDAEQALAVYANKPQRWAQLEFLFRAHQRLIALDEDPKHRAALIKICRELVKAPDEHALLRLEADLLLSQAEQAKKGYAASERADALRPFVERYVGTPAGAKALRMAMIIALELGDTRLVNDLRAIIAEHYSSDLEMIAFLRDHLGGQVFGVPFVGHFNRSDGKAVRFPMDGLGHSSMVLFWSKDNENILQYLADMAAAQKLDMETVDGRLEIISVNLDELPDAGESIIRGVGADWQCLHFPAGRENPTYIAYARMDLLNLRVAPTGQTAMVMHGSTRKPVDQSKQPLEEQLKQIKPTEDLERYTESFRRALIRGWSQDDYAMHLSALMTGDFLILDPAGKLDPALPPELQAAAKSGEVKPLPRGANSVPEETLLAIQNCLIAPPQRYHASVPEIRAAYRKMVELCRKALADHPDAPDLWIVRNRLMVALMGLWKTDFDLAHFDAAAAEAGKALDAGYPKGADVIARFCLARQALREPEAKPGEIIDGLVADCGDQSAAGPALAVACMLALDVADEARFRKYRNAILKAHTEHPMMWIFSGFLLDRYHDYWLFQVPFTAGWSFGRREKYEMQKGEVDDAQRQLAVELPMLDGGVLRIPEDLKAPYTAIFLAQPPPWKGRERDDPNPPSPASLLRNFPRFVLERPDLDLMVVMFGDADQQTVRENIQIRGSKEPLEIPMLKLPGGVSHPIVQRLALQSDHEAAVLIDKQGRILAVRSGISFREVETSFRNMLERLDEKSVDEALARGDLVSATQRVMALAPAYDPGAKDERGRNLPKPKHALAHLRARARVYMALKEWDKALADAEAVVQAQLGAAGGMSLRTEELDESEALRDAILEQIKQQGQR